jgi:hypothetical protein
MTPHASEQTDKDELSGIGLDASRTSVICSSHGMSSCGSLIRMRTDGFTFFERRLPGMARISFLFDLWVFAGKKGHFREETL